MIIEIAFLEKGKLKSKINLTPEEFFDPIEEGETFEDDGIPRYNNDCYYLNIPEENLTWTKEIISGTNEDREISTYYFNNGKARMTHRKDIDGYEEIIHTTEISNNMWHIIRTIKENDDSWKMHMNTVIYELEDGSHDEMSFDKI